MENISTYIHLWKTLIFIHVVKFPHLVNFINVVIIFFFIHLSICSIIVVFIHETIIVIHVTNAMNIIHVMICSIDLINKLLYATIVVNSI